MAHRYQPNHNRRDKYEECTRNNLRLLYVFLRSNTRLSRIVRYRFYSAKIALPQVPKPVENYLPFVRTGNLVFINQVAIRDGKILNPGKVEVDINEQQAKDSTKLTILNILAVLKVAVDGNFDKVKRCVQLIGFFNSLVGYTKQFRSDERRF